MNIVRAIPAALIAAALLFGGQVAFAKPVTVGAGKTACRDWAAARKKPEPSAAVLEQWVSGYVSGFNAFAPGPKDALTDYDSRNVLAWVDSRCAASPTSSVSDVLNTFITQLARPHGH